MQKRRNQVQPQRYKGNFQNNKISNEYQISKGIDEWGNTSNYVESEQILVFQQFLASNLLIRGSVPLFWEQTGLSAKLRLSKTLNQSRNFVQLYFEKLQIQYKNIMCINLMSNHKLHQQLLTENFELFIGEMEEQYVKYGYFDLHHQCKDYKLEKLNQEVVKLRPLVHGFKFFSKDNQKNQLLFEQYGVFRINCLDCLDRTNLFMMKVAAVSLQNIIRHLGQDPAVEFGGDEVLTIMDDPSKTNEDSILLKFKHLWADCGDYISQHYAGTGATTSTLTKTGKAGLFGFLQGGIKGIERFYVGNFQDSYKQECIEIILGHVKRSQLFLSRSVSHDPYHSMEKSANKLEKKSVSADLSSKLISNYMTEKNKESSTFFSSSSSTSSQIHGKSSTKNGTELNVYLLTWNINALDPATTYFQISGGFRQQDLNQPSPDIIAIAFQELVSLNTQNVLNQKNEMAKEFWLQIMINNIKNLGQYEIIAINDMVGLILVIFANKLILDCISDVIVDEIKCGFANTLGNKGAVAIHMKISDIGFSFVNCHLPSGDKKIQDRLAALEEIHEQAFSKFKNKKEGVVDSLLDQSTVVFLLGDLNFRVSQEYREVIEIVKNYRSSLSLNKKEICQSIMQELYQRDQLHMVMSKEEYNALPLNGYREQKINFLPTYQFDQMTDNYDTSIKQRTPSWQII